MRNVSFVFLKQNAKKVAAPFGQIRRGEPMEKSI